MKYIPSTLRNRVLIALGLVLIILSYSFHMQTTIVDTSSTTPTHLIIVCGHAIWLGGPSNGTNEKEWALASFQDNETATFVAHIKAGLEELSRVGREGVLMFSGGVTNREVTPLSEAESYLNLTQANSYFNIPIPQPALTHIKTESYSTDSHENLLFSLSIYLSLYHQPPQHLTIISHAFKERRFRQLHAYAVRWPVSHLSYIGIDPPTGNDPAKKEAYLKVEERVYGSVEKDLYRMKRAIDGKRRRKGWMSEDEDMSRVPGYKWIKGLMEWDGGKSGSEVYQGKLPWDELSKNQGLDAEAYNGEYK